MTVPWWEKGRTSEVRSGRGKQLRRPLQIFAAAAANVCSVRCEPFFILQDITYKSKNESAVTTFWKISLWLLRVKPRVVINVR